MPQSKTAEPLPLEQQDKSYMWIEPSRPTAPAKPLRKAAPQPKVSRPPRFNVPSVMPRRRMMKA